MTRRAAMVRGAVAAVAWAALLVALLGIWRAAHRGSSGKDSGWGFAIAGVLLEPRGGLDVGRTLTIGAALAAAAIVGAYMGTVALRVSGDRWSRASLLAVLSIPALYLVVAVTLTFIFAVRLVEDGPWWSFVLAPVSGLFYGLVGAVMVFPVGALAAIGAAATLERLVPPSAVTHDRRDAPRSRPRSALLWLALVLLSAFATMVVMSAFSP